MLNKGKHSLGKDTEYMIRKLTKIDELKNIQTQWQELQGKCEIDIPFNTFDWYYAWWTSFAPSRRFEVFVLSELNKPEKLVAIIPTYSLSILENGKQILSIWANTHSFRTGIICDKSHYKALNAFIAHLYKDSSWIEFQVPYLVASNSAENAFKLAITKQRLPYLSEIIMESPVLKIEGSWENYFKKFGRSTRESFRRKTRKLLEKNNAHIEIHTGTQLELDTKLNDCWEISKSTWKHKAGTSIASDPKRIKFYEEIAMRGNGWIVISLLYLNNVPIAFEYNLLYKGTLFNLKLGYDEKYRKLSPGIVLRLKMLEWAFEKNEVNNFDFMGNAAEYKTIFSTTKITHENIIVYPSTMMNYIVVYYKGTLRPKIARYLRPIKQALKRE